MLSVWLKAAHVAAVVMFVAGVMLQSLGLAAGARGQVETVALVSWWDRRVTAPMMVLVWLSGGMIASLGGWFSGPWLWVKLVLVVGLSGLHGMQAGRLRRLRRGDAVGAGQRPFLIPAGIGIVVAVIAVLAVVKPF